MAVMTVLLSVMLLSLGHVHATPKAACTKRYSGEFTTNQFQDTKGDLVFKPYYFNSHNQVAYDAKNPEKHDKIIAEFQTCTPNYAQELNKNDDDVVYGRFYIPKLKKCLAVTDPSSNPPYYLGVSPCPSAQDMTTKASIPFNFVSDETGGEVDMRWLGGTIPSKKIYQGPNPPAKYCYGQYYVNSTNLQYGYNFPYLGQPNTRSADDYRIRLYCGFRPEGKGTGFNSFLVPIN
ncbi:hypothetical protein FRC08_008651 [Ceratobasidium sp. 394]|nr:hypothetical protein FRC08_008651 [Ceratobasidium sp. 394]KAG9086532.1 hypothetical protein FS749_003597 [Ceratobasidium sp. UAMH 11750]